MGRFLYILLFFGQSLQQKWCCEGVSGATAKPPTRSVGAKPLPATNLVEANNLRPNAPFLATLCSKKRRSHTTSSIGFRQRPTLPGRLQPSTIGTEGLNFCVRYGNRWDPFVITTGNCELVLQVRFSFPLRLAFAHPRLRLCFPLRFGMLSRFPALVKPFRALSCLPAP